MPCKDTPNFIANRIGSFFGGTVQQITVADDYTIEEVDALTGSLIGLPNSASFRLLDIVGLDVMAAVSDNLYRGVPNDPWRERFRTPEVFAKMIERRWLRPRGACRVGEQRISGRRYAGAGGIRGEVDRGALGRRLRLFGGRGSAVELMGLFAEHDPMKHPQEDS